MDLSLLPLVFSLILTVASRLLHLYSTDNKTSRLMMKRFSTMRDTRRGAQSYKEKRRGRKETEVARRIKGGIKRRETDPASNQFPKCSPLGEGNGNTLQCSCLKNARYGGAWWAAICGVVQSRTRLKRLSSSSSSKCSPQPRTHKEIHRVGLRRKWGGGR